MTETVKKLFMVGAPRSGTTLLQAIISSHPDIFSFPETQYIPSVIDQFEDRVMGEAGTVWLRVKYIAQRLLLGCGLTPSLQGSRRAIGMLAEKINCPDLRPQPSLQDLLLRSSFGRFVDMLDTATLRQGRSSWLLKCPNNTAYIDVIERYIPEARFIHIIRPGADVIASIYDAAIKYPDTKWNTRYYRGSIERLTRQWLKSIESSSQCLGRENHCFILYEDLVAAPAAHSGRLFEFIGITDDASCVERYSRELGKIVSSQEVWKAGMSNRIVAHNKFAEVFDADQQQTIYEMIENIDLNKFRNISSLNGLLRSPAI